MKPTIFVFENFRIDPDNAVLLDGERPVVLAPKPFQVLCHMVTRPGRLITKEELLDAVWPNLHVSESSLSFSMNAVRIALGDDAKAPRFIQTVPRRGYRFIASVATQPAADGLAMAHAAPTSGADWARPNLGPPGMAPTRLWVGRDGPMETLEKVFHQAATGERQMMFITGEAGIGKTTLVDMTVERGSSLGFGVLRGRCTEMFGTGEAFLPLIEALQDRCRRPDAAAMLKALRDHAPTWLAQMPGFLDTQDRTEFQNEIFGANRERMLREFCDLIDFLGMSSPWVIIVEDAHWSDFATLDVLSRLARRYRRCAVVVLTTYRPAEVIAGDHPIRTIHQDLQIHKLCNELALDRLSQAEVEQYLLMRFDSAAVAQALTEQVFGRTRGQPLFVVSMVDYFIAQKMIVRDQGGWRVAEMDVIARSGMPDDLRQMITRQIDRLTAEEQLVLGVASAGGTDFSAALVAAGTGTSGLQVEQTLDALARKGQIITVAGISEWPDGTVSGRYVFQHALYQEVVYQRLAPAQLVRTHRRLGERLEAGYKGQTIDIAPVLALHFEGGRDSPKAVEYLELAAHSAAKRFGNREAANYLTRALTLAERLPLEDRQPTRIRLLQQRGWVRRAAGDFAGSIDDLKIMIEAAADSHQLRQEVSGLLDLSAFCVHSDRQQAVRAAELAAQKSRALDDERFRALVQGSSASIHMYLDGWRDEAAELCRHAVNLAAESHDPRIQLRRYRIESLMNCMSADYQQSMQAAVQVKSLAREAGDVYLFTVSTNLQLISLLHLGEWRQFRRNADAALAIAERNANRLAAMICGLMTAWLHVEALDFAGARQLCDRSDTASFDQVPLIFFIRRIVLAKAYLGLRDYAAAGTLFDQMLRRIEVDATGTEYAVSVTLHHACGEYWLSVGDTKRAREQAMCLHGFAAPAPDRNHLALAHRLLARIALASGDLDKAVVHANEAVSTLQGTVLPHAAWRVYRTAAACHARRGNSAVAADYRERSEVIVRSLADNFDPGEPLRHALLAGAAELE